MDTQGGDTATAAAEAETTPPLVDCVQRVIVEPEGMPALEGAFELR